MGDPWPAKPYAAEIPELPDAEMFWPELTPEPRSRQIANFGIYVRRILRLPERLDIEIESSSPIGMLTLHPCFQDPAYSADDARLKDGAWYEDIAGGVPAMATLLNIAGVAEGDNLVEFVFPLGRG
jgi:hypothetical protein